jgi:Spy/CpxP family protein refolding chaperone
MTFRAQQYNIGTAAQRQLQYNQQEIRDDI